MKNERIPARRGQAATFAGAVGAALMSIGLAACGSAQTNTDTPQISVTFYPAPTRAEQASTPNANEPANFVANSENEAIKVVAEAPVSPTAAPTSTPAPAPTATTVQFSFAPAGPDALISGVRHERQTWNNCGPATISMLLSHYGRTETQKEAATFLKPDPDDKNVSPNELVAYAHSLGYGARAVVGGDLTLLRTLVSNGLPVIVESWFIPKPDDEMGHYQLLIGYEGDDLIFYDSYEGPDLRETVQKFEPLWKVFNRMAVVVWRPEQEQLVQAILGPLMDDSAMYEHALAGAQAEIAADAKDKFAWFNAGTNLLALSRSAEASNAYDSAIALNLPWRMMWYQFGPYQAYFEQNRHEDVVKLTSATLKRVRNLEESLYWRGRSNAALGNVQAARGDLAQAIQFNPNYAEARTALDSLNKAG